jgi:hypothetical protein
MSDRACAVLLKASPRAKTWEFISYTVREEVAWRSASILLASERANGSPNARVAVVLREDYDVGKIRLLKPPKGFKDLSNSVPLRRLLRLPPSSVPEDDLDRQVDTDRPVKVTEAEPPEEMRPRSGRLLDDL